MYAILAITLVIAALAAAKYLPVYAVLGVVTITAVLMRRQIQAVNASLAALAQSNDPWAKPSRDAAKLMKRSLDLALSRTELASCFPGRGF